MRREQGVFLIAETAAIITVLALVSLPLESASEAGSTTLSTAPTSSTSSTTLGGGQLVFVSPTSEQGLQLRVVLNSSTIPTNGTLGAQIASTTRSTRTSQSP